MFRNYAAVSIQRSGYCCSAATSLGDRRFVTGSVPQLPLANCSMAATCVCRYRYHNERRDDIHHPAERHAGSADPAPGVT